MWHTPYSSNNVAYPDVAVTIDRDPTADPTTPPAGFRGEWSANPTTCFASDSVVPVAQTAIPGSGWSALPADPATSLCVRWIGPNPTTPADPNDETVRAIFHVTPNGTWAVYDPSESVYGLNLSSMRADNMANNSPLYGSAWYGDWNQTILAVSVNSGSNPPAPGPGNTIVIPYQSSVVTHAGSGSPVVNWTIRADFPSGTMLDPSYDPGGPDGLNGVLVLTSPGDVIGGGTPLPYTCAVYPDGDSIPGGGTVACTANGVTVDNGDATIGSTLGWRLNLRLFQMPGFSAGGLRAWAWNQIPEVSTDPMNPDVVTPVYPLAPGNHPIYGLIDPNGAPYALRNLNMRQVSVPGPGTREHRANSLVTMSYTGVRQYQVTKTFVDPSELPPPPGGSVTYDVALRHQSVANETLTSTALYDFFGADPLSGSPVGDVVPELVSVTDANPGDDTAWSFEYWCGGDSTPTVAEATGYTWEPTPIPCGGLSGVRGIRAVPTPVHDPLATGVYPVYQDQWDPGDPINASTLRQHAFRVVVRVPDAAQAGDVVSNRGAATATQFSSPVSSDTTTATSQVDYVVANDDDLGTHLASTTLTLQPILDNDDPGPDYPFDLSSLQIVSGPSGGTATINGDGTIDWALPPTPGTYTFTYEICNTNPNPPGPPCDTALVTVTVEEDPTTTTTEPTTTTTEPTTTTTEPTTTTTEPTTTTTDQPTTTVGQVVADMEIDKAASSTMLSVGQVFSYTLTYRNLGPDPATDVVVTDSIPASLTIVAMSAGCSRVGNDVTCLDPGPVPPNPTRDPLLDRAFEITVRADLDGVHVNDARVTAAEADPELGNNTDRETVVVTPEQTTTTAPTDTSSPTSDPPPTTGEPGGDPSTTAPPSSDTVPISQPIDTIPTTVPTSPDPDLSLTKTVDVTRGPVGQVFTYTLTWTNLGPQPAEGVRVVDELPDGLVLVSADPTCEAVGQIVTCWVLGTVPPATSGSFTLTARATRTGEFLNRAFVASSTSDTNPSNDADTATVATGTWRLPTTGATTLLWLWLASITAAVGFALAMLARRPLRR